MICILVFLTLASVSLADPPHVVSAKDFFSSHVVQLPGRDVGDAHTHRTHSRRQRGIDGSVKEANMMPTGVNPDERSPTSDPDGKGASLVHTGAPATESRHGVDPPEEDTSAFSNVRRSAVTTRKPEGDGEERRDSESMHHRLSKSNLFPHSPLQLPFQELAKRIHTRRDDTVSAGFLELYARLWDDVSKFFKGLLVHPSSTWFTVFAFVVLGCAAGFCVGYIGVLCTWKMDSRSEKRLCGQGRMHAADIFAAKVHENMAQNTHRVHRGRSSVSTCSSKGSREERRNAKSAAKLNSDHSREGRGYVSV